MKHFLILSLAFLFAITSACYAQPPVTDTHPEASISAMDYDSGQETPRFSPAAILFKDALVELCTNTPTYKMARIGFGRKTFVITQLDPNQEGNTYELTMQRQALGTLTNVITFRYNIDQNALSCYNPQEQNYVAIAITGPNVNNLNNCATYATQFNVLPPTAEQPVSDAPQGGAAPVTAPMAPPALLDDPQSECPAEGWLWQPGNWAFNAGTGQYQWVAGVWAPPTATGYLWTPSYWAFENGVYFMHVGYWGENVGFYGGLNFGYGFYGDGFYGGRWEGGHFRYNTAVMRVSVNIHNRYEDQTVVYHGVRNRAAFNGRGGVVKEPSPAQRAERETHEKQVHAMARPAAGGRPPAGTRPPAVVRPKPQYGGVGPKVTSTRPVTKTPNNPPPPPPAKQEKKN